MQSIDCGDSVRKISNCSGLSTGRRFQSNGLNTWCRARCFMCGAIDRNKSSNESSDAGTYARLWNSRIANVFKFFFTNFTLFRIPKLTENNSRDSAPYDVRTFRSYRRRGNPIYCSVIKNSPELFAKYAGNMGIINHHPGRQRLRVNYGSQIAHSTSKAAKKKTDWNMQNVS